MTEKTAFIDLANSICGPYYNTIISHVNDHIIRMSIMTDAYPWHLHPNSDETFIGIEGTVIIETGQQIFELTPNSCVTIPQNVIHRTRPKDTRSVNLTIERADLETVYADI